MITIPLKLSCTEGIIEIKTINKKTDNNNDNGNDNKTSYDNNSNDWKAPIRLLAVLNLEFLD